MLCEICNKNEASIHVTKIINGNKQELNICAVCADKMGELNIVPDMDIISPFSFQNIVSGLMDYVNTNTLKNKGKDLTCKNCGLTYREFKEKGLLGCSECYNSFNQMLSSVIKGVQGNIEHYGKIPKISGGEILKKRKLLNLKEQLQKAIVLEEYERAAEIRDKIREIENE
ncbi:UvrB/UvrC motif-containing protein [Clostridium sediminicola]|uniref:UvrB/UvrC motif-containing protein n=1 Tax=Clostridium sediminicola TaxID=3114879 RepID=UPI0031F1C4F7